MSVGGNLALVLYLRAAWAEASLDQKKLLRTKLNPMIKRMCQEVGNDHEYRLALKSMLIRLHEVMGKEWRPKGGDAEQIKLLLSGE